MLQDATLNSGILLNNYSNNQIDGIGRTCWWY